MSVSTPSRSSRSGGKSAPKKKVKRAKSQVHKPKKLGAAVTEASTEETRKRVLDSLDHLGHQKLSTEPGGYDLKSWLKSLKTLLDDFEEKLGKDAVSDELRSKSGEIEAEFSKLGDISQLNAEIEGLRNEESDINAKLKEESDRISSRLSAIGGEKTGKGKELEEKKKELQKVQEERKSVSFFSRLVGRSGPPTEPAEKRVKELEAELKTLDEETLNLQAIRRSIEGAKEAAGGLYADLWRRLEDLEKKLEELNSMREARLQLAKEREEASETLRKLIADLKLVGPSTESAAA